MTVIDLEVGGYSFQNRVMNVIALIYLIPLIAGVVIAAFALALISIVYIIPLLPIVGLDAIISNSDCKTEEGDVSK